jgi:carbon monoxide dehydrogenase subunit G
MASDPEFLREVREKGELVERRLAAMAAAYPRLIRATHGIGLLQGLTLRDPAITGLVLRFLYERGVVTTFCLFDVFVVRVEPPLIITTEQLDWALTELDAAFASASEYVLGLPDGALGSTSLEASIDVPQDPAAVYASLCGREFLYGCSPVVTSYRASGPDTAACQGRIDDIPIEWDDHISLAADRREIEQRATGGFWKEFTRRWTVESVPGTARSRVVFHLHWDVGTGGFERVLSLRLRHSLEKAVDRALSGLSHGG